MNTTPDVPQSQQPKTEDTSFDVPVPAENGGRRVLAESIGELEKKVEELQDKRKEDHIFWTLGVCIPLDVWIFNQVGQNVVVFTMIFLIQLIFLIGLASRLQIDWAVKLLSWVLYKIKEPFK
jgi:hypothetical protein